MNLTKVPSAISIAISNGVWLDLGVSSIRKILNSNIDLPDMCLFESIELIRNIYNQIHDGGYVDNPEFCMIEHEKLRSSDTDPRLVFSQACFIAGSVIPGDDVLVALDLGSDEDNPNVLIFDWDSPIPQRWINVMALDQFIKRLAEESTMRGSPISAPRTNC